MKKTITAAIFIFSTLIIYCVGMRFGNSRDPLVQEEKQFWIEKFLGDTKYPCLIVGDSRVYRGLDPAIFSKNLDTECFNLGFDSSGFGPDFFDLIDKRLSVSSPRRLIIAVSPHSMTERGAENNQLVEYVKMSAAEIRQLKNPTFSDDLFPKISIDHMTSPFSKKEEKGPILIQKYQTNGFAPAHQERNDPTQALASYESLFKDHIFSDRVERTLLEKLRSYHQKGIAVYVLRLPLSQELMQLENRLSGFDEIDFKKKLLETNAQWIDLPPTGFETFDGSHLTGESAELISEKVSQSILKN
ncbi:MAG: hypothetical protein H7256_07420 [Bdellovibrio sp.]|nr:hypothetical protein [Bdellovibrio sp.]